MFLGWFHNTAVVHLLRKVKIYLTMINLVDRVQSNILNFYEVPWPQIIPDFLPAFIVFARFWSHNLKKLIIIKLYIVLCQYITYFMLQPLYHSYCDLATIMSSGFVKWSFTRQCLPYSQRVSENAKDQIYNLHYIV